MEPSQIVVSSTGRPSDPGWPGRSASMLARRPLDFLRLEGWPPHVQHRERASARESRPDRALDAGGAARRGDAGRGARHRHRTGGTTGVFCTFPTKSLSRPCAPSTRPKPKFFLRVIFDDYPTPTRAKVKPRLAKHPAIASAPCRRRAFGATSPSAGTVSTNAGTSARSRRLQLPLHPAAPTLRADGPPSRDEEG